MLSTAAPVFSGATIAACIMVVIESISRSHDAILGTSVAVLVPVGLVLPTFMAFMPREDKHSAYWMEVALETATFLFSRFAIMFVFLGRVDEDQGSQQMIFTLYLLALSATLVIGLIHVHRKLVDFFFVSNTDVDERHRVEHVLLEHRASLCSLGPALCFTIATLNVIVKGEDGSVALHDDVVVGSGGSYDDDDGHGGGHDHSGDQLSFFTAFMYMVVCTKIIGKLGHAGLFLYDPKPEDRVTRVNLQAPLLFGGAATGDGTGDSLEEEEKVAGEGGQMNEAEAAKEEVEEAHVADSEAVEGTAGGNIRQATTPSTATDAHMTTTTTTTTTTTATATALEPSKSLLSWAYLACGYLVAASLVNFFQTIFKLDFSSLSMDAEWAAVMGSLMFAILSSKFCPRFVVGHQMDLMKKDAALANPLYNRPEAFASAQYSSLKKRLTKVKLLSLGYGLMIGWVWEIFGINVIRLILQESESSDAARAVVAIAWAASATFVTKTLLFATLLGKGYMQTLAENVMTAERVYIASTAFVNAQAPLESAAAADDDDDDDDDDAAKDDDAGV
jgi:hypothetical protein